MRENAELIKDQMIRVASRSWGHPEYEQESVFDPVVGMLFSACATELANFSFEINQTHQRVTNRLMEVMLPGAGPDVIPAHGLVTVVPIDDRFVVTPDHRFYRSGSVEHSKQSDHLYFVSTRKFPVVKAQLAHMVNHIGQFQYLNNYQSKQYVRYNQPSSCASNELWLGLEVRSTSGGLSKLQVCFDYKGNANRKLFYYLLKSSKWYLQSEELVAMPGFANVEEDLDYEGKTTYSRHYRDYIDHVNRFYAERFFSVDLEGMGLKKTLPDEWLKNRELMNVKGELSSLVWIKVVFPQKIDRAILEGLTVSINAFPVVNLNFRTKVFKTRKYINVFSINDFDSFFDIANIYNSDGKPLSESDSDRQNGISAGHYLIRKEGAQRYDGFNAYEQLSDLIEKLKNESAAFVSVDKVALGSDLKKLDQIIARLEKRLESLSDNQGNTFLYLNNQEEGGAIYVNYWTSSGNDGNNLMPGTSLKLYSGNHFVQSSIFITSQTLGARNRLSSKEKVMLLRKRLMMRDRIVTNQDLVSFCEVFWGERLQNMTVEKGYFKDLSSKGGFERCIDLKFALEMSDDVSIASVVQMCKDLKEQLMEKSSNLFPYRMFVNGELIDV